MVTYEEKQIKQKTNKAIQILKEAYDSKPLGIYPLGADYPNEFRVEYVGLPYIYRGIDKKLQANGIRISGLCPHNNGGSINPESRAYLFLEFLGL